MKHYRMIIWKIPSKVTNDNHHSADKPTEKVRCSCKYMVCIINLNHFSSVKVKLNLQTSYWVSGKYDMLGLHQMLYSQFNILHICHTFVTQLG